MKLAIDSFSAPSLPDNWHQMGQFAHGAAYLREDGLLVVSSTTQDVFGRDWIHVSISGSDNAPTPESVEAVKKLFFSVEQEVYEVIRRSGAKRSCVHLWATLDGQPANRLFGMRLSA